MKAKDKITIIFSVIIIIIFISCHTTKTTISGHYKSTCQQFDYISICNDSTYIIKYSLGNICTGKWKISKDTLFLLDNWKKENLERNDLFFDDQDTIAIEKDIINQLNRETSEINKPIRFVIEKNMFIGIDTTKYNYNKNCILKKVKK